jgi:hypothetical protein
MSEGFYIENQTINRVNFVAMDNKLKFLLAPSGERNAIAFIPGEYEEEPTIVRLLQRGTIAKVKNGAKKMNDTVAAVAAERAAADTAALADEDDSSKNSFVERPCSASTKKGVPCKGKGYVTLASIEAGDPVLCHIHSRVA